MKFKITCSPRARNSVAKKFISSSLAVGLLFNTTLSSFASTLSEDGRYEAFEGNNITVDNVLEEDVVDVEIEGNTMVNVANQKDPVPITKAYTVEGTNHIPLQGEYDGKARPVIEGNTMYYNNDTGELSDTFVEEANLSLKSSFEDQLVTQEMVDSGQEKPENLGRYKVEYKVTGKNKFDGKLEKGLISSHNGANIDDNNKDLRYRSSNFTRVYNGTKLIISGTPLFSNTGINYHKYDINKNHIESVYTTDFILNVDFDGYIKIHGGCYSNEDLSLLNIQIEEGSVATDYEPYKESIKTFYLNSPLSEGDTIENINGKATHVKRCNKVVLDGSDDEDWVLFQSKNNISLLHLSLDNIYGDEWKVSLMADNLKPISYGNAYISNWESGVIGYPGCYHSKNRLAIGIFLTSSVGIRTYLQNNPVTVVYKLKTPIYETISEESILMDLYKDGHLDLNSNVPVNKVDFIPTSTSLNYLYPSTEYTVQFESDSVGKIDAVSLGDEELYNNYSVVKGINRFNITTPSEISSTELTLDGIGFNLSNVVVTEAINESFGYFKGIQSVGQDDVNGHKIEVTSNNKNFFNGETTIKDSFYKSIQVNIEPGEYWLSGHVESGFAYTGFIFMNSDKSAGQATAYFSQEGRLVKLTERCTEVRFYSRWFYYHDSVGNLETVTDIQLEKGSGSTLYNPHQSNTLQIPLSEPLRGLPNGVKDRIIKRNGQWVVERNTAEIMLNGSDNELWSHSGTLNLNNGFGYMCGNILINDGLENRIGISDKLEVVSGNANALTKIDLLSLHHQSNYSNYIYISSSISTAEDFKQWLSQNPVTVVYELATPIYEPLNIDPTISLYEDVTHISNNSNIPANMKVTVDRTMNRAVEAIELAEADPTTENLSQARYWTNLLRESTKKDELQSSVNDIVGVSDIELERKTVSSNIDVYVKSENMLSMSLDTNSVSFENYSGVDDMEMKDAVNITINSSLPYNLNAYMPSDIISSASNKMDKDVLNIKDSSEEDYQHFDSNINKLVLKESCTEGNNKQHSIDLKLASNNAHIADIYKAVIKFEAEQK